VFFSSHIIDDVERVADWIGILHEGKLIVQSPLEDLKRSVKRIVATVPDGAAPLQPPGLLWRETDGRQQALICSGFNETLLEQVRTAGATSLEVQDCSLEDIFVAYARTKPDA
jgi:ABC-2 type transport system ATP-binding protein